MEPFNLLNCRYPDPFPTSACKLPYIICKYTYPPKCPQLAILNQLWSMLWWNAVLLFQGFYIINCDRHLAQDYFIVYQLGLSIFDVNISISIYLYNAKQYNTFDLTVRSTWPIIKWYRNQCAKIWEAWFLGRLYIDIWYYMTNLCWNNNNDYHMMLGYSNFILFSRFTQFSWEVKKWSPFFTIILKRFQPFFSTPRQKINLPLFPNSFLW